MDIYVKNNPARFHLDPIWKDEDLSYFEDGHPKTKNNKNKKNKTSSDVRSVSVLSALGNNNATQMKRAS